MKTLYMTAAICAALSLAACNAHSPSEHTTEPGTLSMTGSDTVEVSAAFIVPPFAGRDTAAGFFTLQNKGAATRLVSVTSPISERVEIHNHIEEDGIMKMRRVEGVDLATGETVVFKPGSYHLMMFKTALAEGQTDAQITLTYANGANMTMVVPIEGREDESGGGHSGH